MEIYKLYKKIFNNVVISKIIYEFVRFEHIETDGNMDYSLYEKITNSFKYFDITIEKLIKNELHSLFDDYFQFYFNYVMSIQNYQDKIKYIEYVNLDYTLDKNELIYLLGYKQLGLNRFKVIYNHYKQDFITHKNIVLSSCAISGNLEIYSFLKKETIGGINGINGINGNNGNNGSNGQILYPVTTDLKLNNHLFMNINLHESNGNFEIFKDLYDGIRKLRAPSDNSYALYSTHDLILWTLQNGYTDQCLYVLEQLKQSNINNKPDFNLLLMSCSLSYSNIELAKYLVEKCRLMDGKGIISNGKNIFNLLSDPLFEYQKNQNTSPSIGLKNIDYNVFNYYWNQLDKSTQLNYHDFMMKFLGKSTLLNFNFNSCNYSNEMIIMELSKNGTLNYQQILFNVNKTNGYSPTINEFKELIDNPLLSTILDKVGIEFLNRLLIEITSSSTTSTINQLSLEYFKLILSTISIKFPLHKLPIECFDSKFEIIKIIYENYKSLIPDEIEFNKYENKYSFFGDVRSCQYYYFTVLPNCLNQENKFFNLSNMVLPNAIIKNYYEIVILLISTIKSTKLLIPSTISTSLINHKEYNCFLIYKFLYNLLKIQNSLPSSMLPLLNGIRNYYIYQFNYSYMNKYKHFRIFNSGSSIGNFTENDKILNIDIIFIKQYFKSELIHQSINQYHLLSTQTILDSKLSILIYKFNQLNLKISKYLLFNPYEFIKQLFNYPSRFNIIIQNDSEFIITHLKYIIKISIKQKNPIILNLILSSSSYNDQLKSQTFITTILTILSNIYQYMDKISWFLDIKYPKLISFDKISAVINSPPFKQRRMKNIYSFVLDKFKTQDCLNNPNMIAIVHCLYYASRQPIRDNNDEILNGINKIKF